MSSASSELLKKYGVNVKDILIGETQIGNLLSDLRNNISMQQSLLMAWNERVFEVQDEFAKNFREVVAKITTKQGGGGGGSGGEGAGYSAKQNAELLSDLCTLGEKIDSAPHFFVVEEAQDCAEKVVWFLQSPSMLLKLLSLTVAKWLVVDPSFTQAFLRAHGHWHVGTCLDSEVPHLTDVSMTLISRMVKFSNGTHAQQDVHKHESMMSGLPKAERDQHGRIIPKAIANEVPIALVNRIVSMLDMEDQLNTLSIGRRRAAVNLLRDMLEYCPAKVAAADGVRVLLQCCLFGSSKEEVEGIVTSVLGMYEDPSRRIYLRDSDLSVLCSPFTIDFVKDPAAQIVLMNAAREVLCQLICSWTGLFWLASETMSLRGLIDILHLPGPLDRKMILISLFNSVLRKLGPHRGIPIQGPWTGKENPPSHSESMRDLDFEISFTTDESSSVALSADAQIDETVSNYLETDGTDDAIPTTKAIGYNVMDPFLSTALLVLNFHGLPKALITIVKNSVREATVETLTQEAAVLLQYMLILMDTVLPRATSLELHDSLNYAIAELSLKGEVFVGSLTSRLFHNLAYSSASFPSIMPNPGNAATNSSSLATYTIQHDETQFQQYIKDSHVEQFNEATKWNFEVLMLLVQGPLRNAAKLRWVRDNTRFLTRVLAFYRPSVTRCYGTMRREECTPYITAFGLALMDLMLSTRDGVDMLEKADFARTFKTMFQEVKDNKAQILTEDRMIGTMTPEYFRLFGRFTLSSNGLSMLLRHNVFSVVKPLYDALQDPTAKNTSGVLQDVCHQLLQHMYLGSVPNFGICREIRDILKVSMESISNPIRLCAVMQLKKVMWRDLSTSMQWGIQRLVDALGDSFFSVVECSLKLLTSMCSTSQEALDYLISCDPVALVQNKVISDNMQRLETSKLLYKMLSRPAGFSFLDKEGWIKTELNRWEESQYLLFVAEVDKLQHGKIHELGPFGSGAVGGGGSNNGANRRGKSPHTRSFSDPITTARGHLGHRPRGVSMSATSQTAQTLFPLHIANELCATEAGCKLFSESNLWQDATDYIIAHAHPNDAAMVQRSFDFNDLDATYTSMANNNNSPLEQDGSFSATTTSGGAALKSLGEFSDDLAEDIQEMMYKSEQHRQQSGGGGGGELLSSEKNHPDEPLLSASRGYEPGTSPKVVMCSGEIDVLRASILVVAHAGASDVGMNLVLSEIAVFSLILDLAKHASHLCVRGAAIMAVSLFARCSLGRAKLKEKHFSVLHEETAYVCTQGAPFSVSFSHYLSTKWMKVPRRAHKGHAPIHAYKDDDDPRTSIAVLTSSANTVLPPPGSSAAHNMQQVPKEIAEKILLLANPIGREGAKQKLYMMVKEQPELFNMPCVVNLCTKAVGMYRLRHSERKFVSDCLARARTVTAAPQPTISPPN